MNDETPTRLLVPLEIKEDTENTSSIPLKSETHEEREKKPRIPLALKFWLTVLSSLGLAAYLTSILNK